MCGRTGFSDRPARLQGPRTQAGEAPGDTPLRRTGPSATRVEPAGSAAPGRGWAWPWCTAGRCRRRLRLRERGRRGCGTPEPRRASCSVLSAQPGRGSVRSAACVRPEAPLAGVGRPPWEGPAPTPATGLDAQGARARPGFPPQLRTRSPCSPALCPLRSLPSGLPARGILRTALRPCGGAGPLAACSCRAGKLSPFPVPSAPRKIPIVNLGQGTCYELLKGSSCIAFKCNLCPK